MKYSIIIPCYNESENICNLIEMLQKIPKKYKVEFILVENGSTDDSRKIFEKINIDNKFIKKIYINKNKGYGYGIIEGLKIAKGEYVGWLHADLQYNPLDLLTFFDYIADHDGQKLLMKGKRKKRKLIEQIFTFCMGMYETIIFRKKMKEVMSMPVIFNRELLKDIDNFPLDFSIDIYVYVLAQKEGYLIKHLPIYLKNRENGKSSWNNGFISRIRQSKKVIKASFKIRNKEKR